MGPGLKMVKSLYIQVLQKRKENLIIKEQEKKSENEKREIRDEIQEIDNEIGNLQTQIDKILVQYERS